jgi:phage gpG-like protein
MIDASLLGGEELAKKIEALAPDLQANLYTSIARLTMTLLRNVKADKLSGQALNVRTGRLRRSINQTMEGQGTDNVSGTVGTNVSYGRAHEFGFSGSVTVKASLRTIKQAFGRSITPMTINVAAHSRKVNIPERSFLRSALAELEPEINESVKDAILESFNGNRP